MKLTIFINRPRELYLILRPKPFSPGAPHRTSPGELTTLFQTQESDKQGIIPPHSPLLRPGTQRPELVPHVLDQSYVAPAFTSLSLQRAKYH